MFFKGDDSVYRSDLLAALPWVRHGFGTTASDGWPGDYTWVKQIHSDIAVPADGRTGCLGQGDALVLSEPGTLIGVRTADCVPILLAHAESRIVAAVHAGWRGTAHNIVGKTVRRLLDLSRSDASSLVAAIGPAIGHCCFEVGPEVGREFRSIFPERADLGHIDLPEANRRQLLAAGVPADQIDVSGLCTKCGGAEFHSYRRDKEAAGRMVAAIGIDEKSAG